MLDRLARKLVGSFVEPASSVTDDERRRREREQELKRRAARAPSAEFREAINDMAGDITLKSLDWLLVEKTAVALIARQTASRTEASRAVTERMRRPMVRALIRRYVKEGRDEAAIGAMIASES